MAHMNACQQDVRRDLASYSTLQSRVQVLGCRVEETDLFIQPAEFLPQELWNPSPEREAPGRL